MPRRLVLVGGGHTHALLLHALVENPLPDVRVVLVSNVEEAPYSGMLPGHVAGFYSHREMHIDLPALCEIAGAEFILAEIGGFDPESRALQRDDGSLLDLSPDLLSFNVGSVPKRDGVPGAGRHAIPSKPVPDLLEGWGKVVSGKSPERVLIVGGGAGGVELTLAMQSQLPERCEFILVHAGETIMDGHNDRVAKILAGILADRGVKLRLGRRVVEVETRSVRLDDGSEISADAIFWVTQPSPPDWLSGTGLALSEKGFIRVSPTLQAVGYPWIFAAGDVAAIEGESLPRSGVYAVRMAKPLEANLRASVSGKSLRDYEPQKRILSLIGTADGRAVASWGPLAFCSGSMWSWKDRIDRRFMRLFEEAER